METYVIFLYADGEIQWTTGDNDGGTGGLGGNPAQIGFNRGDGTDFGIIPSSGTANVINVASTSNVGVNGLYIFKISDANIQVVTSKKDAYRYYYTLLYSLYALCYAPKCSVHTIYNYIIFDTVYS